MLCFPLVRTLPVVNPIDLQNYFVCLILYSAIFATASDHARLIRL